jgi:hypothetical protein
VPRRMAGQTTAVTEHNVTIANDPVTINL